MNGKVNSKRFSLPFVPIQILIADFHRASNAKRVVERAILLSVYLIEFVVGYELRGRAARFGGTRINLITDLCASRRDFMAPNRSKRGS